MATTSPESPRHPFSPVAFIHPRLTDRGSYVQRWKALRDRNKNLPKIDFNTKAIAELKRQNSKANLGIARSLTLDSMKLPSISNGSIANGSVYTTKSNKETGSRKVGVQVLIHFTRWQYNPAGKSETESILSDNRSQIHGNLSKSLPNVANIGTQEMNKPPSNSHRYERIAQQKTLMKRTHDKKKEQHETEGATIDRYHRNKR